MSALPGVLDRLPNGFARTPSNVEIPLLRRIFSPEEASLVGRLRGHMEAVDVIADRVELPPEEARRRLMKLARRDLVWFVERAGSRRFRLAPFIVGIFETQLETMDHELAHLVEQYFADGGASGIMKRQSALDRVVPAQRAVKSE